MQRGRRKVVTNLVGPGRLERQVEATNNTRPNRLVKLNGLLSQLPTVYCNLYLVKGLLSHGTCDTLQNSLCLEKLLLPLRSPTPMKISKNGSKTFNSTIPRVKVCPKICNSSLTQVVSYRTGSQIRSQLSYYALLLVTYLVCRTRAYTNPIFDTLVVQWLS